MVGYPCISSRVRRNQFCN